MKFSKRLEIIIFLKVISDIMIMKLVTHNVIAPVGSQYCLNVAFIPTMRLGDVRRVLE